MFFRLFLFFNFSNSGLVCQRKLWNYRFQCLAITLQKNRNESKSFVQNLPNLRLSYRNFSSVKIFPFFILRRNKNLIFFTCWLFGFVLICRFLVKWIWNCPNCRVVFRICSYGYPINLRPTKLHPIKLHPIKLHPTKLHPIRFCNISHQIRTKIFRYIFKDFVFLDHIIHVYRAYMTSQFSA